MNPGKEEDENLISEQAEFQLKVNLDYILKETTERRGQK